MKLDTIIVLFVCLSAFLGSLYLGMLTEAFIFLGMTLFGILLGVYEKNYKS